MSKLQQKNRGGDNDLSLLSLGWELGWMIVIPIVLLAVGGALLDKQIGTSPWMLLLGVAFSILITSVMVYQKVIRIIQELDKETKTKK